MFVASVFLFLFLEYYLNKIAFFILDEATDGFICWISCCFCYVGTKKIKDEIISNSRFYSIGMSCMNFFFMLTYSIRLFLCILQTQYLRIYLSLKYHFAHNEEL